jgi:hypothetical protein
MALRTAVHRGRRRRQVALNSWRAGAPIRATGAQRGRAPSVRWCCACSAVAILVLGVPVCPCASRRSKQRCIRLRAKRFVVALAPPSCSSASPQKSLSIRRLALVSQSRSTSTANGPPRTRFFIWSKKPTKFPNICPAGRSPATPPHRKQASSPPSVQLWSEPMEIVAISDQLRHGPPSATLGDALRPPPPGNGSSAAPAASSCSPLPSSPGLTRAPPAAAAPPRALPVQVPAPLPLLPLLLVRVHQLRCSQRRRGRPRRGRGWREERRPRRLLGDERRGAHGAVRYGHVQGIRPRRPAPQQARVRRPAETPSHRHHRPGR